MYNHLCLSVHLFKLYNRTFTYGTTQIINESFFCVAFIEIYNIYFVYVAHLVYGLFHIFGSFIPQTYIIVNTTQINTQADTTSYLVVTITYIHISDH